MRRVFDAQPSTWLRGLSALLWLAFATNSVAKNPAIPADSACSDPKNTVYLTFDTGHMAVAPLVAEVLNKQGVKVSFFVANERTKTSGGSLDDEWAGWWKARRAEGHEFASHTWDHGVYLRDTARGFAFKPTSGIDAMRAGRTKPYELSADEYCAELRKPLDRLKRIDAGFQPLPLFRAPGGKTSPKLLAAAKSCGFTHVGWTPAGFLGDELSSTTHPNATLLAKALREVKGGDILLAHLGIWSRQDPWAPAVLDPLITGLKAKGLCFAKVSEHPGFQARPSR
jgi:peptidoglycan-N-acetylmuramic acid deacetylase